MTRTESYKEYLLKSLRDPEVAAHYLLECLEDEDPAVFRLALRDTVEARGFLWGRSRRAKSKRKRR